MLLARAAEEARIGALLEGARAGEGDALAITGEAGMGKSALLARAAQMAGGMRVLRAGGGEMESTLAHAALHQLLAPVLDRAAALAAPQARALRTAFGLQPGDSPERFLIALGALT